MLKYFTNFIKKYIALGFTAYPLLSSILRLIGIYTSFLLIFGKFYINKDIIFSTLSLYFYVFYLVMTNMYIDYELDKVAHPKRALPSGKLSLKEARINILITLVLIFVFGIFVANKWFVTIITIYAIAYFIITKMKYFKFIPFLHMANNAIALFIFTVSAGIAVSRFPTQLIVFSLAMFFVYFGNISFASIRDMDGDRKFSIETFATKLGGRITAILGLFFCMLGIISSIILSLLIKHFAVYWIVTVAVIIVGAMCIYKTIIYLITNDFLYISNIQTWFDHLDRVLVSGIWISVIIKLLQNVFQFSVNMTAKRLIDYYWCNW